jgi:hypothetical protein
MAGFVFMSSSALDKLFEERAKRLRGEAATVDAVTGVTTPVRRPYRGIQIKNDTYATMSIVDGNGKNIPLISESYTGFELPDGAKGRVNTYADFVLQSISEERTEKNQIIETFGDSFVFFFGERPRMLNVSGILVNTDDFGWRSQFMYNYENFLRGSKLVQRNARMFLAWDTIVVEGYPINVAASEDSNNPYTVNFQMQVFLTNYQDFGRIGVVDFPSAPKDTKTFDALNRDLEERDAFISTTLDVRRLNLESRGGATTLGGFIREGIKSVSKFTDLASGVIQSAQSTLSGRVVRTPLGIAGFLNQVGQGSTLVSGFSQSLEDQFAFAGVTDTKIKVPSRPEFQIVDTDRLRTRISRNVDEYPLLEGSEHGAFAVPSIEEYFIRQREAARKAKKIENAAVLVGAAELAQQESNLLENIQDFVTLARTGFAMVNTARAVLADPGGVALDAMGLSGAVELVG